MKVNILVLLCTVALTRAGYHQDIGFPLAAGIKEAEDKLFATGPNAKSAKIIGGRIAPLNEHPYLAGLLIQFRKNTSSCGSSLISADRLVTAAHCWFHDHSNKTADQIVVVLGSQYLFHGGLRISTKTVWVHPGYDGANLNDIAVIYLPRPVEFSESIHPILLPEFTDVKDQFVWEWAKVAGYGYTKDGVTILSDNNTQLHDVSVQVIPEDICHNIYPQYYLGSIICTSGKDGVGICGGDSGGPLYVDRNGVKILIGIAKFRSKDGCESGDPSGFIRVSRFLTFIVQSK